MFTPFANLEADPPIHGFLHSPSNPNGHAIILTHGAGANCQSKLLAAISEALAASKFTVLRFDLPFRRVRPHGPPAFGAASKDRDGLRRAAEIMRSKAPGRIFLGGHSYGGRQATMLISEEPQLVDGMLLLSYPLHPPRKPGELRTKHFHKLAKPCFFVHGTRDPFGTIAEMQCALKLIPAAQVLFESPGAGHDLLPRSAPENFLAGVATSFEYFSATSSP